MRILTYRKRAIEQFGSWTEVEVKPDDLLDILQQTVGGDIEPIHVDDMADTGITIYASETGRINNLPVSFFVTMNGQPERIYGNVAFVRDDGKSLTDEQIEELQDIFA